MLLILFKLFPNAGLRETPCLDIAVKIHKKMIWRIYTLINSRLSNLVNYCSLFKKLFLSILSRKLVFKIQNCWVPSVWNIVEEIRLRQQIISILNPIEVSYGTVLDGWVHDSWQAIDCHTNRRQRCVCDAFKPFLTLSNRFVEKKTILIVSYEKNELIQFQILFWNIKI